MKIAQVVPPWLQLPPKGYGGIESIVELLTQELVAQGHDVTLFSVGATNSEANLFSTFTEEQRSYLTKAPSPFLSTCLTHTIAAYKKIADDKFDIVHDHTWKEGLLCAEFLNIPTIHTLHSPCDKENRLFYEHFTSSKIRFVAISEYQRQTFTQLDPTSVIYNAIEIQKYPFLEKKEDFYFYLGRFCKEKSPHLACEFANKTGNRLILAGKVYEDHEQSYFEKYIEPQLSEYVSFVGELGFYSTQKMNYLSKAKALLNPIQWAEPFGIIMAEAQACGTPVVTFDHGSTSELVSHAETGYIVDNFDDFVEASKAVDRLQPIECRKRTEELFSVQTMTNKYVKNYQEILE